MGAGASSKLAAAMTRIRVIQANHSASKNKLQDNLMRKRFDMPASELYNVGEEIGLGSMGEIHFCTKKASGQEFALKTIQLARVSRAMISELKNEIKLLQQITHPNIIRPLEVFNYRHCIELITDLCTGGDLYTRQPYSEAAAGSLVLQILRAIAYLHSVDICHRDIKFENILFESPDKLTIKLIDFGLSAKYKSGELMEQTVGTLYSMAPEVVFGTFYNEACDLWSVGVVLYMLLFNKMPFRPTTWAGMVAQMESSNMNEQVKYFNKVNPEARRLVPKLIDKNPETRMTAEQALSDPWIGQFKEVDAEAVSSGQEQGVLESLQNYGKAGKMKKAALMVIAYQCSAEQVQGMRDVFLKYDSENNGTITVTELREAMAAQGIHGDELEQLFDNIDLDRSGKINYTEFLAATVEQQGFLVKDKIREAFDRLDADDNGYITLVELRALLGKDFTEKEAAAMIAEADTGEDGKIDYHEFERLMMGSVHKEEREKQDEMKEWVNAPVQQKRRQSAADALAFAADRDYAGSENVPETIIEEDRTNLKPWEDPAEITLLAQEEPTTATAA